MGIGLSGMISGLDTDSIVKAMVSGQQAKATKIENKITLNKWTKEAWSGLNTKIYSFYTKYASKLRLQTSYMTRTASSSNESIVKATAGSGAALGTHSLQVRKLASSQYVTGGQLKKDGNKADYNKNSKLTQIGTGVTAGTIITITGKRDTAKEKEVKLEVTDETTVNDFLTACKDAGLTASFDTNQQRFFISSSESGSENAFSITTSQLSENANNSFKEITSNIDTTLMTSDEKTKYEDAIAILRQNTDLLSVVLDPTSAEYDESDKTQKELLSAIDTVKNFAVEHYAENTAIDGENTDISTKITTAWNSLDTVTDKEEEAFSIYDKKYTYEDLEDLKTQEKSKLNNLLDAEADKAAYEAVKNLNLELETENYVDPTTVTKEKFEEAQNKIADANLIINDNTKTQEEQEAAQKIIDEQQKIVDTWNYKLKDENGNDLVDENGNVVTLGTFYTKEYDKVYGTGASEEAIKEEIQNTIISQNKTAYDAKVEKVKNELLTEVPENTNITELKNDIMTEFKTISSETIQDSASGLSALGLGEVGNTSIGEQDNTEKMVVIAASDAEFVLDGATMTETSNSFTVNGLTLNLSGTTKNATGGYDTVQITVGKDVDSTYKLVKEALTEYNKLLEEMNTLYNADSARGYDPLTDEQKESMSETDIENWEKKIKDSLLRRDDTLGSLLTSMRTALSSSYTDEDGKTYSLSTYGIVTGNYTEKGKLHIYGDEEDATYATYTDRLKAALEDDPDQVMEVLTHVFGNLYETMTEKCAKTEISSALTFYNDKQYNTLLKDYEDDLDILEDRIKELEDRYYKQFTAMETAMSKLQNQSSSLASLLGTSTQ